MSSTSTSHPPRGARRVAAPTEYAHPDPPPPGRTQCRRHRVLAALILIPLVILARPGSARAQAGPAVLGAAGGFAAGVYTTVAIYVTKARFGRYLFSVDELISIQPEILPAVALPVAGAWLGAESGTALWRAAGWGSLGLLAGAGAGALTGAVVSDSDEAPWAGAIIGGGLGLLGGMALGALDGLDDGTAGGAPVSLSISFPLGG
jgi:hypothetical protein